MSDVLWDALDEINRLKRQIELEKQKAYTRGYNEGLKVGQEKLVEHISNEVKPIYVKIDDCKWIDLK